MLISYGWLLAIVLGSMFIGCCVGVVMMAMCKVSAHRRWKMINHGKGR